MKIAGKIIPKEYIDQLINEYGKQIVSEALTIIDMVGEESLTARGLCLKTWECWTYIM